MKPPRIFWKLLSSLVLVTTVSFLTFTTITYFSFKDFHYQQIQTNLEVQANLIKFQLAPLLKAKKISKIQEFSKYMGTDTHTRLTVILPSGEVIADSQLEPHKMPNHKENPEIHQALTQSKAVSIRKSETLNKELMYVAVPIHHRNKLLGIIRASVPLTEIKQNLWAMNSRVFKLLFVFLLLSVITCWWLSNRISLPLEAIKRHAERIADGDFNSRLKVTHNTSLETKVLNKTLNKLTFQLEKRIKTVLNQKNEREAIFRSMSEGVIAIRADQTILSINDAARSILDIEEGRIKGTHMLKVVHNPELIEFINAALNDAIGREQEITLNKEKPINLFLRSASLKNLKGKASGVVIVINDITKIKQLENHRKDFVANVSHELRTPLTAIQGFAETLASYELDDPKALKEFAGLIHRHAVRLSNLVEDLLSLSRLEQDAENNDIELHTGDIKDVVEQAMYLCQKKAQQYDVQLALEDNPCPRIRLNSPLLEQAVVNLINNGIAYSKAGNRVCIQIVKGDNQASIYVKDSGIGIPKIHLHRIFERFYRVDKARSRKIGGTGLGLAIVKHIALAHGGKVDVESTLGVGTVFGIHIPI